MRIRYLQWPSIAGLVTACTPLLGLDDLDYRDAVATGAGAAGGGGSAGATGGGGSGGAATGGGGAGGSAGGTVLWSKAFGTIVPEPCGPCDEATGSVATDGEGNVIVAGGFMASFDLGGGALSLSGPSDTYLAKLDPDGAHLWSKRFGGPGGMSSNGLAVAQAPGGQIVVTATANDGSDFNGTTGNSGSNDAVVGVFDATGTLKWTNRFGDPMGHQMAWQVVIDGKDLVLAGYFSGSIGFGGSLLTQTGSIDSFIARLGLENGAYVAQLKANDRKGDVIIKAIARAEPNRVVVAGTTEGSIDLGCAPVEGPGFVAKLDATLGCVWHHRLQATKLHFYPSVAASTDGKVVVTGGFEGTASFGGASIASAGLGDAFVVKLDPDGNHVWTKRFGHGAEQRGHRVALDAKGHVVLAGLFAGTVDFGGGPLESAGATDAFVVKLDANGNHVWSRRFGAALDEHAFAVAIDAADGIAVLGGFVGTVDFGDGKKHTSFDAMKNI
jgi:hypothetical protein